MQIWNRYHKKTTITTYIIKFWKNIRKAPKSGVLALKVPGGQKPVFPGSAVMLCVTKPPGMPNSLFGSGQDTETSINDKITHLHTTEF